MMGTEQLYVVQWIEPNGEATGIGLEIEEVREIVASDTDWALVESDLGILERIVAKWPGWSVSGSPAEGHFVDIGGAEFEVRDGRLIEDY